MTSTPLNDLPAQDLRYRLVAHLDLRVDLRIELGRLPVDTSSAKITTLRKIGRKLPLRSW